jgi:hypothetical protein
MASPARSMDLRTGTLTYSTADLKYTEQHFSDYGIRLLAQDEIADQLPLYPNSLPQNHGKLVCRWTVQSV